MRKPGPKPGLGASGLALRLGLGPGEFEARARPSRAQARAFRPSRARDITTRKISPAVELSNSHDVGENLLAWITHLRILLVPSDILASVDCQTMELPSTYTPPASRSLPEATQIQRNGEMKSLDATTFSPCSKAAFAFGLATSVGSALVWAALLGSFTCIPIALRPGSQR
ncbi:hypothetical protein C8F04DRAFT_1234621 [Mycena alexandri]|uniref:Uncharacterized protein n=1 Tax=Mycena alexandri TaxID=1745969 RepID=A0AAD6SU53_9AGAR|nr:hypothetical protein C8F04DRAFT_1234621 [Mycena alexandri]